MGYGVGSHHSLHRNPHRNGTLLANSKRMATKRAVDIHIDEKQPVVPVSQTEADAQAIVDAYAKRCPEKFEVKRKALEAWVASFKKKNE